MLFNKVYLGNTNIKSIYLGNEKIKYGGTEPDLPEGLVPDKITGLKAIEILDTSVTIVWDEVTNTKLKGYGIYIPEEVTIAKDTTFKIEGLRPNTIYSVRVMAINTLGDKGRPMTISVRTKA